jgi:hypothetical protein
VSPAGGGAASDPELLQALFNAAAGICKTLAKQLTAALPATLKHTAGAAEWAQRPAERSLHCASASGAVLRPLRPCRSLQQQTFFSRLVGNCSHTVFFLLLHSKSHVPPLSAWPSCAW